MNTAMLNEIKNAPILNEITNDSENANVLSGASSIIYSFVSVVWLELIMFVFAVLFYVLFMGGFAPQQRKPLKETEVTKRDRSPPRTEQKRPTPKEADVKDVDVAKHVAMIRGRAKERATPK